VSGINFRLFFYIHLIANVVIFCYNTAMICFVIAMASEAAPVIEHLNIKSDEVVFDKRVVCGSINGINVGVVVCGVGKVNAAAGAQYCIDKLNATKIINIGVAGGLNSLCKVGDIYGISHVVQYDFDLVQLNGTAIGTLNEFEDNYLPLATTCIYPLKKLATGDRFNDSKDDFNLLTSHLSADIRDMECGAIAQVCAHAKVSCYSFKSISDVAGSGSTTEQYLINLKKCTAAIKENVAKILEAVNG
jgi:adenosylhomocysteine nucleosidase